MGKGVKIVRIFLANWRIVVFTLNIGKPEFSKPYVLKFEQVYFTTVNMSGPSCSKLTISLVNITKTCLYNFDPLNPSFI